MNTPLTQEALASRVRTVLRGLHSSLAEVEASAVVTRDGLTVASLLTPGTDPDRFGAMCASLLALAARASKEVDRGELRQIILDGKQGPLLLTHVGDSAVLALAAVPRVNLGRLILETRKAAADLAALWAPA
jgi:predicted regulator of Ras-like GTPase activity (Roadblock/LC7/MglB family)